MDATGPFGVTEEVATSVEYVSPRARAAALAQRITDTLGPVTAWSTAVLTADGKEYIVYPPGQDPIVTHQLHLDSAHGLECSGCDSCRQAAG